MVVRETRSGRLAAASTRQGSLLAFCTLDCQCTDCIPSKSRRGINGLAALLLLLLLLLLPLILLLLLLLPQLLTPRDDSGFVEGDAVGKRVSGPGRPCAAGAGVQLGGLGLRETCLLLVLLIGQAGVGGMSDGELVDEGVVGYILMGGIWRGVCGELWSNTCEQDILNQGCSDISQPERTVPIR